jgi:hypothetical protein
MALSLSKKLRVKESFTLLTLHAPADFKKGLGKLPVGVKITVSGKKYDQVHWFVLNKTQQEKNEAKGKPERVIFKWVNAKKRSEAAG